MKKIISAFVALLLVSCGGDEPQNNSIFIKVDSSLGACLAQPCSPELQSFESKALTWEVNIPRVGQDSDEDPNVGQYLLNSSEYEFTISGEDVNFTSDSSIYVIVRNCTASLCPLKDDIVQILVEKDGITYTLLFYGTEDAQLDSDRIPSADLLTKMMVSVEIFTNEFDDYLNNESAHTDVYIFD